MAYEPPSFFQAVTDASHHYRSLADYVNHPIRAARFTDFLSGANAENDMGVVALKLDGVSFMVRVNNGLPLPEKFCNHLDYAAGLMLDIVTALAP